MNNQGKVERYKEEYKYLNDLTMARIRDANLFWISSIGSLGLITSFATRLENYILVLVEFLLIPPFIYAISWQLDGIARVRTYVSEIIEPEIGGLWEVGWKKHPLLKSKSYFVINGIPLIFITIYLIIVIILDLIVLELCKQTTYLIYIYLFSANLLVVWSCFILKQSFSVKKFVQYRQGWRTVRAGGKESNA